MGLPFSTCCIGVKEMRGRRWWSGRQGGINKTWERFLSLRENNGAGSYQGKDGRRGRRRDGTREKCCDKASQVVVHRPTPHFIRQLHCSPYRPPPPPRQPIHTPSSPPLLHNTHISHSFSRRRLPSIQTSPLHHLLRSSVWSENISPEV